MTRKRLRPECCIGHERDGTAASDRNHVVESRNLEAGTRQHRRVHGMCVHHRADIRTGRIRVQMEPPFARWFALTIRDRAVLSYLDHIGSADRLVDHA